MQTATGAYAELTETYHRLGYVTLRDCFTPEEVGEWQAECDRILASDIVNRENIRTPFRMNSGNTPERVDPVVDISPVFANLVADNRLLAPLRALLGDNVILFKDKLILKLPETDGYIMHQDWAWGWQDLCPADDILSVSVQIDGADPENGSIELFGGYHHKLLPPAGLQTNFRADELALIDPERGEKVRTKPGDMLIFHALTPHQSGRNTSTRPRRSLYLTYNAARAGNLRDAYYDAYAARAATSKAGTFFR